MTAGLIGYDPERAGGVFTFGGTGTSLYGVKLGLEKACPDAIHNGVSGDAVILVSDAGHYCAANIAGWLGIGTRNLVTVPTTDDNEIDLVRLEEAARKVLTEGRKIAAIIATMGTTDSFGLDDLQAIAALRDALADEFHLAYLPHIHADAVIGWAWSVFNDYDFEGNPLGFRPRTLRALAGACRRIRHLALADSVGVDFHKTGFAPYISSLVLVKDRADLQRVARDPEQMPYLYHSGEYRPGMYTLETSRAGTGPLAAMANYRLFGRQGLQVVLGHIVEMAQLLREHLEGREGTTVLNRDNFGTVTLFRAYPPGVDTFAIKRQEFDDPRLPRHPAGQQRVQPEDHPVRPLRSHGRPRRLHLQHRLLPPHRLRRTHLRPQVLHPVPVRGRSGRRGRGPEDHGSAGEGGVGGLVSLWRVRREDTYRRAVEQ